MTPKKTIVGIGELLWDIYRDERYIGGAPANVALTAHELGSQGVVISRVGQDGMGDELIRSVASRGLVTDYVQQDKRKGTGSVFVSLDVHGVPRFHCSDDVAFDYLEFTPQMQTLAEHADAVVFGTLGQRMPTARETIQRFLKSVKGLRIYDVNARMQGREIEPVYIASLEMADILRLNEPELELLKMAHDKSGEKAIAFIEFLLAHYGLRMVIVTFDKNGAQLFTPETTLSTPGIAVESVDSTGAGDAFTAGFVHFYLQDKPLQECLTFANELAAYVCTQRGAAPALPAEWSRREK